MARSIRSNQLETRTARLKLAQRWKPYTASIGPGLRLGYRRKATAGSWSAICADGKGGNWMKKIEGDADDFEDADGKHVLDFWQACDRARLLARGEDNTAPTGDRPPTVGEALDVYEADLKARGGDLSSVARVRLHGARLLGKVVGLLVANDLKTWRNGLRAKLAVGSVNRICNSLRAALNAVADNNPKISRHAWEVGLAALSDGDVSARNVILSDAQIRRIVAASYDINDAFGLLVEVAAVTGARVGQLARLTVGDVQAQRVMIPSSRKGKGKKVSHTPVAIPPSLVLKLKAAGKGSAANALLLTKAGGEAWGKSQHNRQFARAVDKAGADPDVVTIYALRHSSIVRQLRGGVPIRVVSSVHDTSVKMIEAHYSKEIASVSDDLTRPHLIDLTSPATGKVVPITR